MKCQNSVWFSCSWYGEKAVSASLFPVCPFDVYPIHMSWTFLEMWLMLTPVDHNSSWEANSDTSSWEISHILCTLEVLDWVGSPPLVCTLSQINQVSILLSNFLNIDFSIILPSVPLSSMWSLSVCSSYQNCVCISVLPHTCHVSYPSQHPWFYPLDTNWWTVSISSALCSFLHLPLTSSSSATNFLLSI